MLVLSVRVGESIYIDDDTVITLLDRWEDEVDLQIDTNQVITIDDTKPQDSNLHGHAQVGLHKP